MLKYGLAILAAMAIAAPAGATVYPSGGTNPQNITITLVIPCYTQVYWNSADDQAINFNDIVQNGSNTGDWYRTDAEGLTGAYHAGTHASQDPWADGYFESYDKALFWLDSNCNTTMTLTSAGNLANGTAELPTWYTICLTNNMYCTWNVNCGFVNGGARAPCGIVPLDGQGLYMDDEDANTVMELDPDCDAFYPLQYSFPMENPGNTTYTAGFTAHAQGTVLFHARALRNALADPAGTYTTTLAVNFTNP